MRPEYASPQEMVDDEPLPLCRVVYTIEIEADLLSVDLLDQIRAFVSGITLGEVKLNVRQIEPAQEAS